MAWVRGSFVFVILVFHIPASHATSGNTLPRASSEALGMADANVALASGPSAQFINPANIADRAERASHWEAGSLLARVSVSFSRAGVAGLGAATVGSFDADTQRPLILFAAFTFAGSDRRAWGFSVESPHGLTTEWPDRTFNVNLVPLGGTGTADIAKKGELSVIRIGPSAGFVVDGRWRLGGRIFAQTVDALDKNDIFTADGDGVSMGAQIGVRYVSERTIFGAAYTSRTNTEIEGSLRDIHPVASAIVIPGDAKADILLPDRLQAGVAFRLRPDLWWELDLDWIGWSYVDELTIVESDGSIANAGRNARDNDDTLSVRTAVKWLYRPRLTLYAGLGDDPTPVPDEDVTPIQSFLEKTRLGLGGRYLLRNGMRLDFAYQFVRGHGRTIGESKQDDFGALGDTDVFEGKYSGRTHTLGVSLAGRF